jgi:hypothetical protein
VVGCPGSHRCCAHVVTISTFKYPVNSYFSTVKYPPPCSLNWRGF